MFKVDTRVGEGRIPVGLAESEVISAVLITLWSPATLEGCSLCLNYLFWFCRATKATLITRSAPANTGLVKGALRRHQKD